MRAAKASTIYCIQWYNGTTWIPYKPEIDRQTANNICKRLNSRTATEKRYRVWPYGAKVRSR